jgi:DNA-binding transcriptional MerR regulator
MEMRVEQLSLRSGVPVDTVRYYQSKGLLEPPRREGRVAWYHDGHLRRLERIRSLQERGFTLATIVRLVDGDLDAADEALIGELSGTATDGEAPGGETATGSRGTGVAGDGRHEVGGGLTLAGLAEVTGVPLALLKAVEAEGLLIPRRIGGEDRYTAEDVESSRAGLLLLEWGIPLSALLEVSRRHHQATEAVAREAVAMFATHIRAPLRRGVDPREGDGSADGPVDEIARLLQAYEELLPAVTSLVGHHFTRALAKAALEHVEQVGSDEERRAIWDQAELAGHRPGPAEGPGPTDGAGVVGAGLPDAAASAVRTPVARS